MRINSKFTCLLALQCMIWLLFSFTHILYGIYMENLLFFNFFFFFKPYASNYWTQNMNTKTRINAVLNRFLQFLVTFLSGDAGIWELLRVFLPIQQPPFHVKTDKRGRGESPGKGEGSRGHKRWDRRWHQRGPHHLRGNNGVDIHCYSLFNTVLLYLPVFCSPSSLHG